MVTPYTGVWIETEIGISHPAVLKVTPYTGVWIETHQGNDSYQNAWSHPTRVCGLKQKPKRDGPYHDGHTLHGCVD